VAWDEWEQLKADAATRQQTPMQINNYPGDRGPTGNSAQGDLEVSHKDLAAIGDKAFTLWDHLGRQGRVASASSEKAAKDLSTQGFLLGDAVKVVEEKWEKQLKSVLDACAQISHHMDFTQKAHQGDEHFISGQLSSIASLDKGFDSRDETTGQ
jgi:hypothetical protein